MGRGGEKESLTIPHESRWTAFTTGTKMKPRMMSTMIVPSAFQAESEVVTFQIASVPMTRHAVMPARMRTLATLAVKDEQGPNQVGSAQLIFSNETSRPGMVSYPSHSGGWIGSACKLRHSFTPDLDRAS